jgi:hypothetical protein
MKKILICFTVEDDQLEDFEIDLEGFMPPHKVIELPTDEEVKAKILSLAKNKPLWFYKIILKYSEWLKSEILEP